MGPWLDSDPLAFETNKWRTSALARFAGTARAISPLAAGSRRYRASHFGGSLDVFQKLFVELLARQLPSQFSIGSPPHEVAGG
jgi:hypothetical protein